MTLRETHAAEIEALLARYDSRRSALLPLLYIAQDTYGPLTRESIQEVADILELPYTDAFEVVGFYTLYYEKHFYGDQFGKWVVQVCDDVPCCYLGAEELVSTLEQTLGVGIDQPTDDGLFVLQRVKCLAACDRAPVVQANLCYFYDVLAERADAMLAFLRANTDTQQANSVSGHFAKDYEPGPNGTFQPVPMHLSPLESIQSTAPTPASTTASNNQNGSGNEPLAEAPAPESKNEDGNATTS